MDCPQCGRHGAPDRHQRCPRCGLGQSEQPEQDARSYIPSRLRAWWWAGVVLLLGGGLAVRELLSDKSALRERLGGHTYQTKPWTDAQWDEATDACSRSTAHQTNACFASTFCSCVVRDHRSRGVGFAEFMDLLPALVSQAKYGESSYPCTLVASSTCVQPR